MKTYSKLLKPIVLVFLIIGLIPCFSAAYSPKPKAFTKDYSQLLDRHKVEQQLGRKLRLKERLALRLIRKKLKKQQKQNNSKKPIGVKIKRIKGASIKGYLCKIEKDSVYIIRNSPSVKTVVIPVSNVKKIVLRSTQSKRKRRGVALLLSSLFLIGSIPLFTTGKDRNEDVDGISGGYCLGLLGIIVFGIATLISFLLFVSLNTNVFINGQISEGKLEVLKQYFLDIC